MLLHTLVHHLELKPASGLPNIEITGICEDSRRVVGGSLFIARPSTKAEGLHDFSEIPKYLADAAARGAAAAIVQARIAKAPLPQIVVPHAGMAASVLANAFHGHPGHAVRTLAVTGTNGKTTTTYIIRHLLANMGIRCGMVGTVEIDDGRTCCEASMTTPAACDIAQLLASMREKGCGAAAMEVSSHALDQGRVAGVPFAGAAFTNLTGDHLDYHKTMENYAAAKARVFAGLDPQSVAVINVEDKYSLRMIEDCPARIIRFGFGKSADYRARDVLVTAEGTQFLLQTPDGSEKVQMELIGRHNVENVLAASALVGEVFGVSVAQLADGLSNAQGAPGRLQAVRCGQPFSVLVDYAHTDDALENVLTALRPLTRGKLRVLFGCGGDRDRTKRPRMAQTAEKLADAIYVTSDNPRTENASGILNDILAGFSSAGHAKVELEVDRRVAIERALASADEGDVVLIAGKGHENYQIIGNEKRHFDDVEEATNFLRRRQAA